MKLVSCQDYNEMHGQQDIKTHNVVVYLLASWISAEGIPYLSLQYTYKRLRLCVYHKTYDILKVKYAVWNICTMSRNTCFPVVGNDNV